MDGAEYTQLPFGYTKSEGDANSVIENYDNTLGKWVLDNIVELEGGSISISEYFKNETTCYTASWSTNDLEGFDLNEITNIEDLT